MKNITDEDQESTQFFKSEIGVKRVDISYEKIYHIYDIMIF